MVTVTGCLARGSQVKDGDSDTFVLANPTKSSGAASNAPAQTCTVDANATAVQLDNPEKGNVNESMLGRWVEISGRLERETSNDNILRELDVTSARLLEFEAPRVASAEPASGQAVGGDQAREPAAPAPAASAPAAAEPSPAPQAAAPETTARDGQAALPDTASVAPLTGLIGLFACGAGFVVRSLRSRR